MKLTDTEANTTEKVLLTGLSGSGKSTLAAALAEKFNLKWIDLERGAATLRKLPREWQERIELYQVPDSASYPIAADTMSNLFKTGKMKMCRAHGKNNCAICAKEHPDQFDILDFSTLTPQDIVVLDTGTQLSHSILAHITRTQPTDYKPERDDWGSLRRMTEFFCSQFQAANYNLIVICHVVEAKTEDGKTKLVSNFGSASMSSEFPKAFDHVIYCDVKNAKHIAGSSSTYSPAVLTRSRTDFKIESLPVPSLIPIFDGSHLKNFTAPVVANPQAARTPGQIALDNLKGKK